MDENTAPAGDNQVQATADVSPDTGAGQGNSDQGTSWRDKLPESLKTSKTLAKFTSEEALAKSYVELEAKLGKGVSMPEKDASPEEWDKFYSKLGRPKQASDYAIEPVEGFEVDDDNLTELKAAFHKAGLTVSQANAVFKHIASQAAGNMSAQQEALAKAQEEHMAALQEAWGPKYNERVELTKRFILKVGGEKAIEHLDRLGVSGDAVVLQLLGAAAQTLEAHQFVDGSPVVKKPQPYAYMSKAT